MYVISVKNKIFKGTFSRYVVCCESGSFVVLHSTDRCRTYPFFTCRTYPSFSRTRGSFPSHQISVRWISNLYNEKQRLRCLVLQKNFFSISVMTHKVLSLHTIAVVGSEEVFACFSCLKLCSIVLRFYEADIPNPLEISQIFHIALVFSVAFSAACLSFAELEEFPLHTSLVIGC